MLIRLGGLAVAAAYLGYAAVVYWQLRSSSELQAEITQTRSWLRCTPPWHLFADLLVPALPLIAEITCMINGLLWPAEILSRPWRLRSVGAGSVGDTAGPSRPEASNIPALAPGKAEQPKAAVEPPGQYLDEGQM